MMRENKLYYNGYGERASYDEREDAIIMDEEREQSTTMDEQREQAIIYNWWGERTSYYNNKN